MKIFLCALTIVFTLTACQSAKDAFTLKKKPSGDEFLVEKKSPLVLPPEYGELPTPNKDKIINKKVEENEIKVLLTNDDISLDNTIKNSKPSSLEKSIIEKVQ